MYNEQVYPSNKDVNIEKGKQKYHEKIKELQSSFYNFNRKSLYTPLRCDFLCVKLKKILRKCLQI